MKNTVVSFLVGSFLLSSTAFAAPANYKVSMRVDLKGQSPISINTVAKSGKKSYVSQFSDDGLTETLVTVYAKKSQVKKQDGLLMDVSVTKRVRGELKMKEKAQMFAPENQETEFGTNSRGKKSGNLSLAVMTHRL